MFFRQRTIWWPTLLGWAVLLAVTSTFALTWWIKGEAFLSLTERREADVLVVEGWIGADGIIAAKSEFETGGYTYIVATSGLTGEKWEKRRWSYAVEAEEQMLRMGMAKDRVILAQPSDSESRRTYEAAVAVRKALMERGISPKGINIFTMGPHARRSRLVYAKVNDDDPPVGCIAWVPPVYLSDPWWHSSERSTELIKETVGWAFEFFLNSGRLSNTPHLTKH